MPQEHYVMTVQSMWNRTPRAAATVDGIIETDGMTAKQVYDQVKTEAINNWHRENSNTSLGKVAVLFYDRTLNESIEQ